RGPAGRVLFAGVPWRAERAERQTGLDRRGMAGALGARRPGAARRVPAALSPPGRRGRARAAVDAPPLPRPNGIRRGDDSATDLPPLWGVPSERRATGPLCRHFGQHAWAAADSRVRDPG